MAAEPCLLRFVVFFLFFQLGFSDTTVQMNISSNGSFYKGNESEILVYEKQTVVLKCTLEPLSAVRSLDVSRFEWQKDGKFMANVKNKTSVSKSTDNGTLTLTIQSVTPADSGIYHCYANNLSKQIFVGVTEPPIVSLSPMSISVFSNEDILLKCFVENWYGYENWSVTWYMNNDQIQTNNGSITNGEILSTVFSVYSNLTTAAKQYNKSVEFSCKALLYSGDNSSSSLSSVTVFLLDRAVTNYCEEQEDKNNSITWGNTKAGQTSIQPCPAFKKRNQDTCNYKKSFNTCSRKCFDNCTWGPPKCENCVDEKFSNILLEIDQLKSGVGLENKSLVANLAEKINNATNKTEGLNPGNLNASVEAITSLSTLRKNNPNITSNKDEVKSIVHAISNVLNPVNKESWGTLQSTEKSTKKKKVPTATLR